MGLKYAFFHIAIHSVLALLIAFYFDLNLIGYFLIFTFTFLPDLDHLPLIKKYGILGAFYLRAVKEFKKPRKYAFHKMYFIALFLISYIISYFYKILYFEIIFLTFLVHMFWDLFEDLTILKIGVKHWL
jgi:hypothetical protein